MPYVPAPIIEKLGFKLIFSSRDSFSIVFVGGIGLLIVGIWVIFQPNKKHADLENARELWNINKPERYSYTLTTGCMFIEQHEMVHNEHGHISTPLGGAPKAMPVTIDDLFKQVGNANLTAYKALTEYHPYFGYPVLFKTDGSKDVFDDECFIQVTNFKVLNISET